VYDAQTLGRRSDDMKRASIAALLLIALAPASAHGDEVTVEVGHNRLNPNELAISVGDTVIFHNLDEMPGGHSVVAEDGSFSSPALDRGEKWAHTFEEAGTYPYRIKEHPSAKGKITVE
jgi:plastocyanin